MKKTRIWTISDIKTRKPSFINNAGDGYLQRTSSSRTDLMPTEGRREEFKASEIHHEE